MEHFSVSAIWKALTRQGPQEQTPRDSKTENLYQRLLALNNRDFNHLTQLLTQAELTNYLQNIQPVVEREERLVREYPSKEKPTGWQTTDPKKHDPENFRYIVHTIINTSNDYVASLRGEPENKPLTRQYTDLKGFLERPFTSCTLVDEIHRGTYLQNRIPHGFILEVPEKNIVAINPNDMGKPWDEQDEQKFQSRHQLDIDLRKRTPSAQDFLNAGVSEYYNEIVVNGIGPAGRKINISGIFFIVDPFLELPFYELYTRLPSNLGRKVEELRKKKFTEEDIDKMLPELQGVSRMKRQYQQAKDLAELLKVPIVHIPEVIHPDWYQKYVLNE